MGLEDDNVSCVVVGRHGPRTEWEFIISTLRKSVAWRSAAAIQEQERRHGHPIYETGVITRDDWDKGVKKVIKPPKGFEELDEYKEPMTKAEKAESKRKAAVPEAKPAPPPPAPPQPEALPVYTPPRRVSARQRAQDIGDL